MGLVPGRARVRVVVGHAEVLAQPAVAAAGDVESLGVDPARFEGMVDAGHEVLVVLAAPVSDARGHEALAVVMAPARVGEEHRVATAREDVKLMEEGVAVRGMRAAVNLEHERPPFRRVEAARPEHPALDLPAVRARELDALGRGDETGREKVVVEARDTPRLAPYLSGDDVPRIDRGGDHRAEAPARAVERPRDDRLGAPP